RSDTENSLDVAVEMTLVGKTGLLSRCGDRYTLAQAFECMQHAPLDLVLPGRHAHYFGERMNKGERTYSRDLGQVLQRNSLGEMRIQIFLDGGYLAAGRRRPFRWRAQPRVPAENLCQRYSQ